MADPLATLRQLLLLSGGGAPLTQQRVQQFSRPGLAQGPVPMLATGSAPTMPDEMMLESGVGSPLAQSPLQRPPIPPGLMPQRPPQVPSSAAPLQQRQVGPAPMRAIPPGPAPPMGLGGDQVQPQGSTMGTYQGATPGGIPQQSIADRAKFFAKMGLYPFAGQGYTKEAMAGGATPGSPNPPAGGTLEPPNTMPGALPDRQAPPEPLPAEVSGTPGDGFRPGANPEMGPRSPAVAARMRALSGAPRTIMPPPPKPAPPGGAPQMPSLDMGQGMPPPDQAQGMPQVAEDLSAFPGVPQNGQGPVPQGLGQSWLQKLMGNGDGLLNAGLATMAAASRPGASALGAIGEGGLSAVKTARDERRLDQADKREDRMAKVAESQLGLSRDKLVQESKQFLLELERRRDDGAASRETRLEAARMADETRRLMIETNKGNQEAMRELQRLTIEQRGATEGGRREDRQAEAGRRDADAQRKLDNDASDYFKDRMKSLTQGGVMPETDEMRRSVEGEVLTTFGPKSRMGRQVLNRQLGDTIRQIQGSALPDDEKERRIAEARSRAEQALK